IGLTNFLNGTVASAADGRIGFSVGDLSFPGLAAGREASLRQGEPADAAIRAEQVRIDRDAHALDGLDTVLEGSVADAIFEGERVVYDVAVTRLGDRRIRVFDHDPALHAEFPVGARVFI